MHDRIALPDNLPELLDVLDESQLAELAGIAFAADNKAASAICLRALRRREYGEIADDPAQLRLFGEAVTALPLAREIA